MQSIQSSLTMPLASVKPLEPLLGYRAYCLDATRATLASGAVPRKRSPVADAALEAAGDVEGLAYARCPETGSLFLASVAPAPAWATLLRDVTRYRQAPDAVHQVIARSRSEHVYAPKLEWIEGTLRLQGVERPRVLEVVTPPSGFTAFLERSTRIAAVETVDEMTLLGAAPGGDTLADAAVLLETLDRVNDPAAVLRAVARRLVPGGLVFVTALVASGFDVTVLGLRSLYLYPPDRTNCFSLEGLERLLAAAGFALDELSTPGVLDVEIVDAHLRHDPRVPLSPFERRLVTAGRETRVAFQTFLQEHGMSSFARVVGKRTR